MEKQTKSGGLIGTIGKFLDICVKGIVSVGAIVSAVFLSAMFINVIMRYVFNSPIFWTDEMIICLLVWYSALGTVVCYWTNEHAVINFFVKFFNRTGKIFFMFLPHLLVAATSWVFIVGGRTLFKLQIRQLPQGGLPFSRAYYNSLPMIVMGALLMILSIYRVIEYIRTPKDVFLDRFNKKVEEGGLIIE